MALTLNVYTWRAALEPVNAAVRAGGGVVLGGLTLGGAAQSNPEPGGRAELVLDFAPQASEEANIAASWTYSRIMAGSVFSIPLWETAQLVPQADLTVDATGLTWANGEPWANNQNWRANPWVPVMAAASKGAATFTADFSTLGEILSVGHVIGFTEGYDFTHVVMDVAYDENDLATVTVSPPLRRALTTNSVMLFRPSFTGVCVNANEAFGQFQRGIWTQPGTMRFVEALV